MWRIGLISLGLLMVTDVAWAQSWWGSPYGRGPYRPAPYSSPFWGDWDNWSDDDPRGPTGPAVQSGGKRPAIEPIAPRKISFPSSYPVGSIVIDTKGRQLSLVESPTEALYYPISVGHEGFTWTGTEKISRVADWPDWYPPEEMRARDWRLPQKMTGGVRNPLGVKALYLGNTLYRIHGTNDAKSIGRAASSGCFRMLNGHVVDLASRVQIGTEVIVVNRLPPELERGVVEQANPDRPRAGARAGRPS